MRMRSGKNGVKYIVKAKADNFHIRKLQGYFLFSDSNIWMNLRLWNLLEISELLYYKSIRLEKLLVKSSVSL